LGFDKEPFESLVNFRYLKSRRVYYGDSQRGLADISVEELVKMRIFKIDGAYIRPSERADGVSIEVESLVQRRIGVARKHEE